MEEENTKKDIVITYDTLFEILRKEKLREELQSLPANFFLSLALYLKEKREFIQKSKSGLFTDDETEKANKQLQNIIKIIKEIYNKRERKIINIAINKAITGSNLIDTSQLLSQESELFNKILEIMTFYRQGIVNKVINAEEPTIKSEHKQEQENTQENSIEGTSESKQAANTENNEKPDEKAKELKNNSNSESIIKSEMIKVLVLEDIPKFIGPNLEIYGPYQKDSEAIINNKIADILVESNKARILNQEQREPDSATTAEAESQELEE